MSLLCNTHRKRENKVWYARLIHYRGKQHKNRRRENTNNKILNSGESDMRNTSVNWSWP